jgi:general secretion pathway protein A
MYTQYYGFSEKPFNITPDPRFLFLTEAHVEALASLFYGIREKKGFICITGEAGTGKTTVVYRLIDNLSDKVKTAFIYHTSATFDQLLKNILMELSVPVGNEERYILVHRLNAYLLDRLIHDEIVTLFIDEAQNLPVETLEELRMLSNLETRREKLLQIVLVGQPGLDTKLDSVGLKQLRQRIAVRRQIRPLSQNECRKYIDHRLRIVGGKSSKVFEPEAISLICTHAEGIPRLINVICDNALIIGYGAGQKRVGGDVIREVIGGMNGRATGTGALIVQPVSPAPQEPEIRNDHKMSLLKRLLSAVTSRWTARLLR